jgi:hypothetical protein
LTDGAGGITERVHPHIDENLGVSSTAIRLVTPVKVSCGFPESLVGMSVIGADRTACG